MVMKPKPRERSVWRVSNGRSGGTHPLVVNNHNLVDLAKAAKLVLEVALAGTNRKAKDAEDGVGVDAGRVGRAHGRLRGSVTAEGQATETEARRSVVAHGGSARSDSRLLVLVVIVVVTRAPAVVPLPPGTRRPRARVETVTTTVAVVRALALAVVVVALAVAVAITIALGFAVALIGWRADQRGSGGCGDHLHIVIVGLHGAEGHERFEENNNREMGEQQGWE